MNWERVYRVAVFAAGLAALGWLLHALSPILMPFVLGAALAYLGDPLVDRLEARKLSRTAGVCIVFALFTLGGALLTLILAPLLYQQIVQLVQRVPELLIWVQDTGLPSLGIDLPDSVRLDPAHLRETLTANWQKAGDLAARVLGPLTRSSVAMLTFGANIVLVPVVTFYLLRDWDLLVAQIRHLIPRRYEPKVVELSRESDEVLSAFITGQLLVMSALGLLYALGLWLVGLKLGLLVGLLAGMVSFIPYLGPIVGVAAALIALLMQGPELWLLVGVLAVFGVGQVLESFWLTPWLVGDKIGLHPVAVIFALMAGGQLFGFLGIMLALPVAAVLAVMLRHLRANWLQSNWYQTADE